MDHSIATKAIRKEAGLGGLLRLPQVSAQILQAGVVEDDDGAAAVRAAEELEGSSEVGAGGKEQAFFLRETAGGVNGFLVGDGEVAGGLDPGEVEHLQGSARIAAALDPVARVDDFAAGKGRALLRFDDVAGDRRIVLSERLGAAGERSAGPDEVAEGVDAVGLAEDLRPGVEVVGADVRFELELVGAERALAADDPLGLGFDERQIVAGDLPVRRSIRLVDEDGSAPSARIICARLGVFPWTSRRRTGARSARRRLPARRRCSR
jgi:hypothetical protein